MSAITYVKLPMLRTWHNPLAATIRYAHHVFGEFYDFTGKYYVKEPDPRDHETIVALEVTSKVQPYYAECLEHWIAGLNS